MGQTTHRRLSFVKALKKFIVDKLMAENITAKQ
jgi:hypothetical protein